MIPYDSWRAIMRAQSSVIWSDFNSQEKGPMGENVSIIKVQEELERSGAGAELIGALATGLANYIPKLDRSLRKLSTSTSHDKRLII